MSLEAAVDVCRALRTHHLFQRVGVDISQRTRERSCVLHLDLLQRYPNPERRQIAQSCGSGQHRPQGTCRKYNPANQGEAGWTPQRSADS
jgi:hypothetical protein